jgi:DNA processing protein
LRPVSTAGLEAPPRWWHCEPGSPGYPRLLREIRNPPDLVVRGVLDAEAPMVAIVGARRSTAYGEEVAYEIGYQLAAAALVVVSGMARGIDSAAHRGALDGGGSTVAVMGTGPDSIYPPEHRGLAERIAHAGALVSQFPVGTQPLKANFPRRNETISGLSLGVVVVEARRRSGAMLTAGAAGNQNRAVMAVPGSVRNPASEGCHDLLRDGARLVTCARDVVQEVSTDSLFRLLDPGVGPRHEDARYGDVRDDVLRLLRTDTLTLDEVVAGLQAPSPDVVTAVARLRLDGLIRLREGAYGIGGGRAAARRPE